MSMDSADDIESAEDHIATLTAKAGAFIAAINVAWSGGGRPVDTAAIKARDELIEAMEPWCRPTCGDDCDDEDCDCQAHDARPHNENVE